jgi:hypothetical protein
VVSVTGEHAPKLAVRFGPAPGHQPFDDPVGDVVRVGDGGHRAVLGIEMWPCLGPQPRWRSRAELELNPVPGLVGLSGDRDASDSVQAVGTQQVVVVDHE